MAFDKKGTLVLNGISYSGSSSSGSGSSIPWTYIKEIDLSGNNAVSIPELADYDEFYIHSDTDFDILNQYFIKDVTPRINVGAFSSTTYYCLVLGTIDWENKTIKKDAYAHNGWSTSCKFKLYGRKVTSSGGSGSSNLSELNDVQINDDLWDEQLLQYDMAREKWVNRTLYSSGISHVTRISQTEVMVEPLNSVIDELRYAVGQANELLEGAL